VVSDELVRLSLAEAGAGLAAKRFAAVELLEAVIQRAGAVQPVLNAFLRIDAERARDAARAVDADRSRGTRLGRLAGVPMAHKDMFYRAGVPSSCGSRIKGRAPESTTATVLERLDAAGAIQFGVLNMNEFAYGPSGHNWHHGHCRNPWNASCIPGGSSSGSAASVAARANFAALGSDTGASIRLPAALCGVTGLKVTYGRVSRAGVMPLSFSMDTIGPIARTAEDCALVLAAIAGDDSRDPTAAGAAVDDYVGALSQSVAGLRVGVATNAFADELSSAGAEAMESTQRTLASLGCPVVPVTLPDLSAWDAAGAQITAAEGATVHAQWLRTRAGDYSAQVRARLERGLAVPAPVYIDALRLRGPALAAFADAVFTRADVLLAPCLPIATPTIAETDVGAGGEMDRTLAALTRYLRPFNYLGLPSLALPAGFAPDRLPLGVQIVGRPFAESLLLRLGHRFQQATDWHRREPPVGPLRS
jgi:aspartyl-tRNA(Asn)/glutamyl-tRNA(Gln) amidotransferase subunit A